MKNVIGAVSDQKMRLDKTKMFKKTSISAEQQVRVQKVTGKAQKWPTGQRVTAHLFVFTFRAGWGSGKDAVRHKRVELTSV